MRPSVAPQSLYTNAQPELREDTRPFCRRALCGEQTASISPSRKLPRTGLAAMHRVTLMRTRSYFTEHQTQRYVCATLRNQNVRSKGGGEGGGEGGGDPIFTTTEIFFSPCKLWTRTFKSRSGHAMSRRQRSCSALPLPRCSLGTRAFARSTCAAPPAHCPSAHSSAH